MPPSSLETWLRPDTKSHRWRLARELATQNGLEINAARTPECAARQGRYWLSDAAGRRFQAETLNEIIGHLGLIEAAHARRPRSLLRAAGDFLAKALPRRRRGARNG